MADLAKLVVRLEAQTAQYMQQLDRANARLEKFTRQSEKSFGSIAAAGRKLQGAMQVVAASVVVQQIVQASARALELGVSLDNAAKRAAVSAGALSEIAYAARTVDVDLGSLSKGLKEMQTLLAQAENGSKSAQLTLERLGLSVDALKGFAADKQFEVFADRIAAIADPAQRAQARLEVFSRTGEQLAPILERGSAGIRELREEARRLGQALTDQQVEALADAKDAVDRLTESFGGLGITLTAKLAPGLTDTADNLTALLSGGGEGRLEAFANLAERMSKVLAVLNPLTLGLEALDSATGASAAAIDKLGSKTEQQVPKFLGSANALGDFLDQYERLSRITELSVTAVRLPELNDFEQAARDYAEAWDKEFLQTFKSQTQETYELIAKDFEGLTTEQSQFLGGYVQVFEQKMDEMSKIVIAETEKLNVFQEEAARRTQNIIADALTGGFEDGAKGILKAVGQMIVDITAQIVAADLAGKLFGSAGGGKGQGWLGQLAGLFAGSFGGARATGGPVMAGTGYLVGERGPELFVPNTAGEIVPSGAMGMQVVQHFAIQAPAGTVSRQTQQQVAAAAARGIADASRRNN